MMMNFFLYPLISMNCCYWNVCSYLMMSYSCVDLYLYPYCVPYRDLYRDPYLDLRKMMIFLYLCCCYCCCFYDLYSVLYLYYCYCYSLPCPYHDFYLFHVPYLFHDLLFYHVPYLYHVPYPYHDLYDLFHDPYPDLMICANYLMMMIYLYHGYCLMMMTDVCPYHDLYLFNKNNKLNEFQLVFVKQNNVNTYRLDDDDLSLSLSRCLSLLDDL